MECLKSSPISYLATVVMASHLRATVVGDSFRVEALDADLDAERLSDRRYVLDFNRADNPACAYSDDDNCSIPPRANRLQIAIWAGEMVSHCLP